MEKYALTGSLHTLTVKQRAACVATCKKSLACFRKEWNTSLNHTVTGITYRAASSLH